MFAVDAHDTGSGHRDAPGLALAVAAEIERMVGVTENTFVEDGIVIRKLDGGSLLDDQYGGLEALWSCAITAVPRTVIARSSM